ncbi:MAG: NAD(P)-dependent alcohol dehydrogenase [Sphingomonadaceae bacterium]
MEITAAIAHEPGGAFSIQTAQLDDPRDDEILIRIVAVGLCHTDLSVRDQMIPVPLPIVLGHEGAGIVERVGASVSSVKPGDKVLLSFNFCGACAKCEASLPSYCEHFGEENFGGTRRDGSPCISLDGQPISGNFFGQSSFASYALANERNTLKVADDADLRILAPLGCGIQTGAGTVLNVLKCEAGSAIAVFGGGAVGLSSVLASVIQGCEMIIVVEPVEARRKLAIELGATHSIDPRAGDTAAAIRDIIAGGVNYAVDTTAVPAALEAAAAALATNGTLALVGVPAKPDTTFALSILNTVSIGATVRGIVEGDSDPAEFIPRLLQLHAEGKFPFERLISLYPIAEINQAVDDHHHGKCVKAVLTF